MAVKMTNGATQLSAMVRRPSVEYSLAALVAGALDADAAGAAAGAVAAGAAAGAGVAGATGAAGVASVSLSAFIGNLQAESAHTTTNADPTTTCLMAREQSVRERGSQAACQRAPAIAVYSRVAVLRQRT
jgi:hypothetical protein